MITKEEELKKIVYEAIKASTETSKVEFKDCRDGLYKQLWKPITAFFNTPGGGTIILGVKEDSTKEKTVVGGYCSGYERYGIYGRIWSRY